MNIFKQSTYLIIQHVLSSLVYRLIIVLFGVYIVTSHDNIVPAPYYIILLPVYVLLYLSFIGEKWKYVRLVLDMLMVLAVLYGKAPLDNVCLVYALFPLISSITHTGSHSKYWPVLLLTFLVFFVIDGGIVMSHYIIAALIWAAGIQSWYNHRNNQFLSSITSHIDDYFADNDGSKKPHEIYKNIIEEINTYLKNDYIKNIYSYTVKENNVLWLVNSSVFMWDRTLKLKPALMDKLKERKYLSLKEEGEMFFYVEQRGVSYVYRCETAAPFERISYRKGFVVNYVLELTFAKISTLLASEYRISEARRKAFEETKGHIEYVTRALKVMHFVRNKLSPVNSVITFYNSLDAMEESKAKKMESRIKQEVHQANVDLAEIINMANYLLDKQNNPYGGADIENKNIKFLFVLLSEIVEQHLGGTVSVSDDIKNVEQRKEVKVSTTQLKLLFTDIVSNIERYRKSDYTVEMGMDDENLIVRFTNDIYPKQESECSTLAKDINNKNNEGIVMRKSHGVYNIKAAASVMGVELKAKIEGENKNKKYVLTTKFKMYGDKDSSEDTGN